MTSLANANATRAAATPPAMRNFIGVGALLVAGIGVPVMLTLASKEKLTTADQWVLRFAALGTAAIVAPIGYGYLYGLQKR